MICVRGLQKNEVDLKLKRLFLYDSIQVCPADNY